MKSQEEMIKHIYEVLQPVKNDGKTDRRIIDFYKKELLSDKIKKLGKNL